MVSEVNISQAAGAYKNTSSLESSKNVNDTLGEVDAAKNPFKPSFDELVMQGLDKARNAGYDGESVSAAAVANKAEYHELVTAVNNADLTLRTVVAVRDKIVNAYQEILKMPI